MNECEHSFSIFMAGAEAPIWHRPLFEGNARHIAISYLNLRPRLPKTKPWTLEARYPEPAEILVDSGGFGAGRRKNFDHDEHIAAYTDWVAENLDRITMVTEYDPEPMGYEWIEAWRRDFWSQVPAAKFVPIWHERHGVYELEKLCATYARVGVVKPERNIEAKLRALVAETGVKLHGVAITGPEDLRRMPFATVSSTSWISPTRYGDTQVWAGGRFHWYPAASGDVARRRHAVDFTAAGCDAEKIAEGDRSEVSKYTVWAWQQYESDMAAKRDLAASRPGEAQIVDIRRFVDHTEGRGEPDDVVTQSPGVPRTAALVKRDQKIAFPALRFGTQQVVNPQDGDPSTVVVPGFGESNLRRCNSCYLSAKCVAFTEDAECAYHMPIEIRTKEQLLASLTSLLEMQFARIAFSRAGEEADGGPADEIVSKEIGAYFRMVKAMKDIQSDTSFLRIEVTGPAQPGVMSAMFSRYFGPDAAPALSAQNRKANEFNPALVDAALADFIDIDDKEE